MEKIIAHISMSAAEKAAESMTERLLGRDDVAMMSMDWQVEYCENFTIGVLEDMGVIVGEIMRDRIKEVVVNKIASWNDGVFGDDDDDYECNAALTDGIDEDPLRRIKELIEAAEEQD